MIALHAFAVGLLVFLLVPDTAQAAGGAYGPTTLKLEMDCVLPSNGMTEIDIKADHKIADVRLGAAEIRDLFFEKTCTPSKASSQAIGMLAEMTVKDFHGSLYAAVVAFNHFARTSDIRQPAPLIDAGPCIRRLRDSEHSDLPVSMERIHTSLQDTLTSLKRIWKLLSAPERKLLNEHVFKLSVAFLRCGANQGASSSLTFYDDSGKILDENAAFHAVYGVILKRVTK